MKNIICSMSLIILTFHGYSQRLDLPGEYIRQKVVGKNKLLSNVLGSPFYSESFSLGTVYTNGGKSFDAYLRYDAYNDEMQMKNNEEIIALLKLENSKVKLGNELFEVFSFLYNDSEQIGYFIILSQSGNTKLFKHKRKKIVEGFKAQNSYTTDKPPMFKDEISYYIMKGSKLKSVSLSKRKILELLNDKRKELDNYISEKKLKLRNEDDFIEIVNFYNTIP